jgi:hypothetical protein
MMERFFLALFNEFHNIFHGYFNFVAYEAYYHQRLVDYEYLEELVKDAIADLPQI